MIDNLNGSRVLITGGAGFIGSHIADLMIRRRVGELIVLDNLTRGCRENLKWALNCGDVRLIEGDIRDPMMMMESTRGIDYVFHMVGVEPEYCDEFPRGGRDIIINGTFNLLDACVRNGVKKIVAASSKAVYGKTDRYPLKEDHAPGDSLSFFGAFNLSMEHLLDAFNVSFGLGYTALRLFDVYGPRMTSGEKKNNVISNWMEAINRWINPVIPGNEDCSWDFIFVRDAAEAAVKAMEIPGINMPVNIASGTETGVTGLKNAFSEITVSGMNPEFEKPGYDPQTTRSWVDVSRAEKRLGFIPSTLLRDGLRETLDWRMDTRRNRHSLILK